MTTGKTSVDKTQAPKAVKPQAPKITCYIGPSIRGALQQGTIYRGELPESVKNIITKVPELGALMVDINALASAQKELQDPRSGLAVLFAQAAAKAEKGLSYGSL